MSKKQYTNKPNKTQDYTDIFDYNTLRKQNNKYSVSVLQLLIEKIFDPKILPWLILGTIAIVALLQMPATDIKEVILNSLETIKSIKNSTMLLLACLIILTLIFIIFYQYSRQKWDKEMQRVINERDKLQEKLNCPIQSSEDLK
ncbi:MAG: hypothetical protein LBC02_11880 [Planctomycetaceae bacterium]|nr:hypothetical protein [Planctomycetaceae bacterium]